MLRPQAIAGSVNGTNKYISPLKLVNWLTIELLVLVIQILTEKDLH